MRFAVAVSSVALAVFAAAVPQPVKQVIGRAIPIAKRSTLKTADDCVNIDALKSHVASVQAKIHGGLDIYEKNTGNPHPSDIRGRDVRKRSGTSELLGSYDNIWYGLVSVGTSKTHTAGQTFLVKFDTAFNDFFIPSRHCDSSCGFSFTGVTHWDPNASVTSHDLGRTFSLQYEDGTVSGKQYTDVVNVAGIAATTQTIGAGMSYPSLSQSSGSDIDGVMGMGFLPLSYFNAGGFFDTLIRERQVPDAAFSLKLTENVEGSELYIGGSNSAQYSGSFTHVNVTTPAYWELIMDDIQTRGRKILSNIDSIIDTGSHLIIGLPSDVLTLHTALGGKRAPTVCKGCYTFPCDAFPTISFTFGGTSFPISPSTLNMGPVSPGSSDCVSGIVGADTGARFWVIGNIFLQNVYTRFDYGYVSVGFARLACSMG